MTNRERKFDQVDYSSLDNAKNSFIEASRKTLTFAKKYGFIPDSRLGSSANIFSLNLKPYLNRNLNNLYVTLLSEGLGTADDARPRDLNNKELEIFWYNIAFKILGAITNDVASSGVQPVLISLYLPSSSPEVVFNETFRKGFLSGFVKGCKQVGCVYFSGETPQLKRKIFKNKLDIAGAVFGLLPPGKKPIDGSQIKPGDKIVFIGSSGPHENGFTPLRKLANKLKSGYRTKLASGREYWEVTNAPSVLYSPFIQSVLSAGIQPTNVEPITGHGWQKLMRSQKPLRYVIEKMLTVPEIFKFVEKENKSTPKEMVEIFNYGVGLAIYVNKQADAEKIVDLAKRKRLKAIVAGHIEKSEKREVFVEPLGVTLTDEDFSLKK